MYTGNTKLGEPAEIISAVYPCVYREHIPSLGVPVSERGLSLCIQGTLSQIGKSARAGRFIPVYTGNTLNIYNCFI